MYKIFGTVGSAKIDTDALMIKKCPVKVGSNETLPAPYTFENKLSESATNKWLNKKDAPGYVTNK
ncbi:MAG: hypothetical protein ABI741_00340 [Ferruginibacter sp.]